MADILKSVAYLCYYGSDEEIQLDIACYLALEEIRYRLFDKK